jgi:hypothetical protein
VAKFAARTPREGRREGNTKDGLSVGGIYDSVVHAGWDPSPRKRRGAQDDKLSLEDAGLGSLRRKSKSKNKRIKNKKIKNKKIKNKK